MKRVINWKVLSVFVFFLSLSLILIKTTSYFMGGHSSLNRYYLKQYQSQQDLFSTVVSNPNKLFLWCCDCILYYSKAFGVSYDEMNIYLFVIVQPIMILMFATLFIVQSVRLSRCYNQRYRM